MVIVGHNLHSVYLTKTNPNLRTFYNAANVVLCDGYPIFADARSSSNGQVSKIGSTDWIPRLDEIGIPLRVLVVGASAQSNAEFCSRIASQQANVDIFGLPGLPFPNTLINDVQRLAESYNPDIILVGLGMPLQEKFVEDARLADYAPVIACVGGAIDQISGVQRNCPRWLSQFGIEWLWRLLHQPKRLGFRYLVEPFLLAGVLVKERFFVTK